MQWLVVRKFVTSSVVLGLVAVTACASSRRSDFAESSSPTEEGAPKGGGGGSGATGGSGDGFGAPAEEAPEASDETRDPVTCDEARDTKSYVGCDYWPTITPNPVWSIFDYAVVVANTGTRDAVVRVTGPSSTDRNVVVPPGELRKIALPWVRELKGEDFDECTAATGLDTSKVARSGAYHLVSSSPVIVYQFNALQYRGQGGEELDGSPKDWSTCPGTTTGCRQGPTGPTIFSGCYSFTNDASLLLPSTAMTANYRVMGHPGASVPGVSRIGVMPTVLSITSTQPQTSVEVTLSASASVTPSADGVSVASAEGGQTMSFLLSEAGDVLQLVSERGDSFDFSGSLVRANHPVQVITSVPCITIPANKPACDHIEETVLPAETLGRHYVVAPPTGPKGVAVTQKVRLYGNQDATELVYAPAKPEGCPERLSAGEVADCGLLAEAFEVTGTYEFGVATFLLGAAVYDPTVQDRRGDPDQSLVPSVEQFRMNYVFLAPDDYPVRFADVTAPEDADILIDGVPITAAWTKIGAGPFGVYRLDLTQSGNAGAHTLVAKKPIGLQVLGYGDNTSFQVPAGLNLKRISAPPSQPK
jgi:hypothetical protein